MNNVDKFLKDGVKEEFIKAINEELDYAGNQFNIEKFLNEQVKPILSEDERVILRNIKGKPKYIAREEDYRLMAYDEVEKNETRRIYDNGREMSSFAHLFQFIKEGEEYEIRELLGE